jgi:hypothetical protein
MMRALGLHVGETVEVRSWEEIRATLDERGTLEGLPFMPEMVRFCRQRFRVHGRADRTCVETMKQRGMKDTVWLEEARCDGQGHDGCQIMCLTFWKEAWLKRADAALPAPPATPISVAPWPYPVKGEATGTYICQSSQLAKASFSLGVLGNLASYFRDLYFGNVHPGRLAKLAYIFASLKLRGRIGEIRELKGDTPKTPPFEPLGLSPGDVVEVKGPEEIQSTLDRNGRNRGLPFTYDLLEFSGKKYRVLRPIERVIDESTGEMRRPKNAVVLEGVRCTGTYRRGCVRCTYLLWREAWLKRVEGGQSDALIPDHQRSPG